MIHYTLASEELGRHANKGGSQGCPHCEAFSVYHVIPRDKLFKHLRQVVLPKLLMLFFIIVFLIKLCILLVNDESSLWFSRAGDFLMSV